MSDTKYYFISGIMIAFGIGFVMSSIDKMPLNPLYVFGIFFGGLSIGIGLLPFPMRNKMKR